MKKLTLLLSLLALLTSTNAQETFTLDFDDYPFGEFINGIDGWNSINHDTGPGDFHIGINPNNGSNAIFFTDVGPGVGKTMTRKEFGDLAFDFSEGGILEIEWEMAHNWWGQRIVIGFDADDDGHLAPSLDPTENSSAAIHLAFAKHSDNNRLFLTNGVTSFEVPDYEYTRYKLVLDLSANNGAGLGALFFKQGDFSGDWNAITQIQGIDLGLTPGSDNYLDPGKWDSFSFHSQGATSVLDNLGFKFEEASNLMSQFIDFETVGKQLTTTNTVDLVASATSELPVSFELLSGPASLNGNTLTFDGVEGIVEIKATQTGDGVTWNAASPVTQTFEIIDPALYVPTMIVRNPVDQGTVMMPELSAFLLTISTETAHSDVLIPTVNFNINGENLPGKNWGTGYYTTYWTPPAYGDYTLNISVTNPGGPTIAETVQFEVVNNTEDISLTLLEDIQGGIVDTNIVFPSFVGGFENVKLVIEYNCPPEGCEPWDLLTQQNVRGPDGQRYGFMRYITPYGVACSDEQDITDYMSLFQGRVRLNLPYVSRSLITLRLEYTAGTSPYKYTWVENIWENNDAIQFGDPNNPQNIPPKNFNLDGMLEDAKLNVLFSGHRWGENNWNNAAEFSENTHNIHLNGSINYTHTPWEDCNPNPANCSPQNGTWFYDRAGWCPGSLVPIESFSLANYIGEEVDLFYELDPTYTDLCHPSHPDCVSGVTCPDCDDPFFPIVIIDGHLITYSNQPIDNTLVNVDHTSKQFNFDIQPNPNNGIFSLITSMNMLNTPVEVYNNIGQQVFTTTINNPSQQVDLSHLSKGIYWMKVGLGNGFGSRKVIIY